MRTDYKIGIAVALLLGLGLVAYFVITNNSSETPKDTEQEKVSTDTDKRNIIASETDDAFGMRPDDRSGDKSGRLVKIGESDPLPEGESPSKTEESAKSGNLVKKPARVAFVRPPDDKSKTYGRQPAVLIPEDGSESYKKASPSFSYEKKTDSFKTADPRLIKTPPTAVEADAGKARFHTVLKGENGFTAIAKTEYGSTKYWTLIRDANPGVESTNLRPGDVLKIPPLPRTAVVTPKADVKPGALTRKIGGGSAYVVKDGDSYWKIAKEQYGDASLCQVIQDANKDIPANALKPGQTITIPPKPTKTTTATRTTRVTSERTTERTTERSAPEPEPAGPEVVTNDKGEVFD